MVISIIAVLIGILLPVLSSARQASQSSVCLSNLRQSGLALQTYAVDHQGTGPALGVPYSTSRPYWALEIQAYVGRDGYDNRSVLVCPAADQAYPETMRRTYAINVTGHNRSSFTADPDDYDTDQVFIRFDAVPLPSEAVILLDSALSAFVPPDLTTSVIDFRLASHIPNRIGFVHPPPEGGFNRLMLDGSAGSHPGRRTMIAAPADLPEAWRSPLP